MTLTFKNEHLEDILGACEDLLSIDTKWSIVQALRSGDSESMQEIQIIPKELRDCYYRSSKLPEGVSADFNKQVKDLLIPQLAEGAGMTLMQIKEMMQTNELPSGYTPSPENLEALELIKYVGEIDSENMNIRAGIKQNGRRIAGLS